MGGGGLMREDYDLVDKGVVKYIDEEIIPRYKGMAGLSIATTLGENRGGSV